MWEFGAAVAVITALMAPSSPPDPPSLPSPGPSGCVQTIGTPLGPCPGTEGQPQVWCILPLVEGGLEPSCPSTQPTPRGRIVPVTP